MTIKAQSKPHRAPPLPLSSTVLHDSMLAKSIDRARAFFEGGSHRSFTSDLLERQSKGLCFHFSRNHHHPINVTKENVSWPDGHASDFNGNSEIMDLVSRRGILAIRPERESGIAQG